ncbi:MAG: nucleotidyltransferase domain-containing protein [Deltaproteobacteria bacterium]|nr:nucleotidyltransferase domain-containing protein [Deltaproteobacteria bacterium]
MADDSGYDEMIAPLLEEEDGGRPAGGYDAARLTSNDQAWLDAYRVALAAQCPDAVKQFLIYGSKARGEATRDSDLDVVLIVDNRWQARKRDLRRIGYRLASTSDVLPSIVVYTEEEWEARRQSGSFFRRAVERDAIAIR